MISSRNEGREDIYKVLEVWGSGGPSSIPLRGLLPSKAEGLIPTKSVYICPLECRELQQAKNEINQVYQEGKWDDYKKITNPFEYIFLSWNRRSSRSVATRQPLSRSYFKMIELWKRLDLTTELAPLVRAHGGLRTAHSAEGPGGFIEACIVNVFRNLIDDCAWTYAGSDAITLRSDAKNVPGWRKAVKFLLWNPMVCIHDGQDGTGNILSRKNQEHFVMLTRFRHNHGVHLYTADGGFDFSNDYNAQEDSIFPLLLAEAILGLQVLAKGGCIILKCFDTMEQPTLDLLWLLTRAFRSWGLVKPHTSRSGNAERYFIGKGFIEPSSDILDILLKYQSKQDFLSPILEHPINCPSWIQTIERIRSLQTEIEQMEIIVIRQTLNLIQCTDPAIIRTLVAENVNRSIAWCKHHDEEITTTWINEFEKNVSRETSDLLMILNPPMHAVPYSYVNWTQKNISNPSLTFDSFRTGDVREVQTLDANPFMRLKTKSVLTMMRPVDGSHKVFSQTPFGGHLGGKRIHREYEEAFEENDSD